LRLRQRHQDPLHQTRDHRGICNACHPFYTGTQKFVDTAGRVDKFQQRLAKTQAAQAATAAKKKRSSAFRNTARTLPTRRQMRAVSFSRSRVS